MTAFTQLHWCVLCPESLIDGLAKGQYATPYLYYLYHTFIHLFFLKKKEKPSMCMACQEPYTLKPILIDCSDFNQIHLNHYQMIKLKQLFDKTKHYNY